MRCFVLILALAVGCRTAAGETADLPPLRLAEPSCAPHVRTIGFSERAVFLKCGSVSWRVYHPKNLVGLVSLTTEAAALEHVRFFTSTKTFPFFDLHGFVEVLPYRTRSVGSRFVYMVSDGDFEKYLSDVTVTSRDDSLDGIVFTINRSVVATDNRVYRVTERVTRGGNYDLLARSVVVADASVLGIAHIGND